MSDFTRWNRAALPRIRYVDGNAVTFLEELRRALAARFPQWQGLAVASDEGAELRRERLLEQYHGERGDWGWEIARVLARSAHLLGEHLDAYANEGYLGTASQWENLRRLVAMLDYHPAPPASASTWLVLEAAAAGRLEGGFQVKHRPADGGAAVIFESLEALDLEPALNRLWPAGHGRNPEPLRGDRLVLEGECRGLAAGQPLVVEDERDGSLRAHRIEAAKVGGGQTEVWLRPRLAKLPCGRVRVHLLPAERLAPRGPAAAGAELGERLALSDSPAGLAAGETLWIERGAGLAPLCTRVKALHERALILAEPLGKVRLEGVRVGRPVELPVSLLGGRELDGGGGLRAVKAAGDWSRLTGRWLADRYLDFDGGVRLAMLKVTGADYLPPESDDPLRGYTVLTLAWQGGGRPPAGLFNNPHALLAAPATLPWEADRQLLLKAGNGEVQELLTDAPKKCAPGDLAVVMMGAQLAWTRLQQAAADPERGEGRLAGVWQGYGGGPFLRAATTLHGHFKEVMRPLGWSRNETPLSGDRLALEPLAGGGLPASLRPGRRLVMEGAGESWMATVTAVEGDAIRFEPPLPAGCRVADTAILANVVPAGHGEQRNEQVLGSGDATASGQSFLLEVAGVSFVADPAQPRGVRADLQLRVGEQTWQQVADFKGSGPADPHYTVRLTEEGHLRLQFGDGRRGRRLPGGRNNLRIRYRVGSGLAGNLPAGSLVKAVRPHRLVAAVRQPLPASGGNTAEAVEALRENAPATVLALERAVSRADFARLAAGQASVWQAEALPLPPRRGVRGRVEVVVVPAGGGAPGPLAAELERYLLAHALPGIRVTVSGYLSLPLDLTVTLQVKSEEYDPQAVAAAVRAALLERFGLRRRRLGEALYLSEVYKLVEGIAGVENSSCAIDPQRLAERDDAPTVLAGARGVVQGLRPARRQVLHLDEAASQLKIETTEYRL